MPLSYDATNIVATHPEMSDRQRREPGRRVASGLGLGPGPSGRTGPRRGIQAREEAEQGDGFRVTGR